MYAICQKISLFSLTEILLAIFPVSNVQCGPCTESDYPSDCISMLIGAEEISPPSPYSVTGPRGAAAVIANYRDREQANRGG